MESGRVEVLRPLSNALLAANQFLETEAQLHHEDRLFGAKPEQDTQPTHCERVDRATRQSWGESNY